MNPVTEAHKTFAVHTVLRDPAPQELALRYYNMLARAAESHACCAAYETVVFCNGLKPVYESVSPEGLRDHVLALADALASFCASVAPVAAVASHAPFTCGNITPRTVWQKTTHVADILSALTTKELHHYAWPQAQHRVIKRC